MNSGTSRRRDQYVGLRQRLAVRGPVLGADRNTIETHDRERLSLAVVLQLQVENGVRRGIGDPPELLLTGLDLDDARDEARLRRGDI